MEIPAQQESSRNLDGTFKPGFSGNPAGKKPGKTLKEFAREFLMSMDEEQKKKYLEGLDPQIVWRMAEGNPHNTTDVTSGDKPIPILGHVPTDLGNKEDTGTE